MGELEHEHGNVEGGNASKRSRKVRDIFTDRVVGIVGGAFVPLVLLFIPLVNKYLDNTKEIQTLQIQSNADDIESVKQKASEENKATNERVNALTTALVGSQIQLQNSVADLKKVTQSLMDCQKSCDPYCQSLNKKGTK